GSGGQSGPGAAAPIAAPTPGRNGMSAWPATAPTAVQPTRTAPRQTPFNPSAFRPFLKALTASTASGIPANKAPAGPPIRATLPRTRPVVPRGILPAIAATFPAALPTAGAAASNDAAFPVIVVVSLPTAGAALATTGMAFWVTASVMTPVIAPPKPSTARRSL